MEAVMPFVKCISVRSTVKRSLSYILDSEKTDGLLYTASLNCLTDPECAYLNMKMVYEQLSGRKFNEPPPKQRKGHVKAIHYIQSLLEKSRLEVNIMETKCNLLRSLAAQAEVYFALTEKSQLTSEEKLRAEMYRETLEKQNIESTSDYDYLKTVIVETEQKAAPIRAQYNRCTTLLKEYSDISTTYNEISQGDYISKLIEHQRKQDKPQARPRR